MKKKLCRSLCTNGRPCNRQALIQGFCTIHYTKLSKGKTLKLKNGKIIRRAK